jgi:zinc/manganese transport system permease protein
MFDLLFQPFNEFSFMRRALAGCVAISLGAAPLGVFLVLRRMSLTGDAMAHAILPGAAIGYLLAGLSLGAMTFGGLMAGVVVALLSSWVTRMTTQREDASLAAFYLISLATGVLIISLGGNNLDLLHILFGSVLALNDEALILLAGISTLSMLMLAVCYRPLVMECCDPAFLRSLTRIGTFVHTLFLALVVLNLVGGFHALGTLMAVGMMILPAVTARFWTQNLAFLILVSTGVAIIASYIGLFMSFYLSLPSGPAIILMCGVIYVLSLFFGAQGGLFVRYWPRRHLEA